MFNWCEWDISENEVHWPITHYSHGYFVLLKVSSGIMVKKVFSFRSGYIQVPIT